MPEPRRSPFGEELRRYRGRNHLSQTALAMESLGLDPRRPDSPAFSDRSIGSWEAPADDPTGWVVPHQSNVRYVAAAMRLPVNAVEYRELMKIAQRSRRLQRNAKAAANAAADVVTDPSPVLPETLGAPPDRFVSAGREEHLRRLRRAADDAADARPGVVLLSGEEGAGKTSVLEQICREAGERWPDLVTLWAACAGTAGVHDAHPPFRQILGHMVGDLDTASPQEQVSPSNMAVLARRIPAALQAIEASGRGLVHRMLGADALRNRAITGTADAEVRQLAEVLELTSSRTPPGEAALGEQVFRVLARYAESGPVVVVLDDLHQADLATIALLTHIARRLHLQQRPLLILGSSRPGEAPTSGDDRPDLEDLLVTLSRLFPEPVMDLETAIGGPSGRAFTEALLHMTGRPFSQELADALFDRTGGQPLFLTSILDMLDQDAATGAEGNGCQGPMPPHIEAAFARQFERLQPDARRLLLTASVQGDEFRVEPLAHALELPTARVVEIIGDLVRLYRLLRPGGTEIIAGQTAHAFRFRHALFREFCHDRLLPPERSQHHAATARALLALYGSEGHAATAQIAVHLDRAGDRPGAATAYGNAGVHALLARDHEAALRLFARVPELGVERTDPFRHTQAFLGMGNSCRALGRREEAHAHLETALGLAERRALPVLRGHVLQALAMLDNDVGDLRVGLDRQTEALGCFLAAGDEEDASRAMVNRSYLLYALKRFDEAMTMASEAAGIAASLGDDRYRVDASNALGICLIDLGRFDEALAIYTDAVADSVAMNDRHLERLCQVNVALAHLEQGQWAPAQEAVDRVLEAERGSMSRLLGLAELNAGLIAEGQADLTRARAHFANARDIREANGQHAALTDCLAALLRVAVAEGDRAETRRQLREVERRVSARGLDGIEHLARLYIALMQGACALGEVETAHEHARQTVRVLHDIADALASRAHRASFLATGLANGRALALAAELGAG